MVYCGGLFWLICFEFLISSEATKVAAVHRTRLHRELPTLSDEGDQELTNCNWIRSGCFAQVTSGGGLLRGAVAGGAGITRSKCFKFCTKRGYHFAGLLQGSKCYCGGCLSDNPVESRDIECNKSCRGDASDAEGTCGGEAHMEIFICEQLGAAPVPANFRCPVISELSPPEENRAPLESSVSGSIPSDVPLNSTISPSSTESVDNAATFRFGAAAGDSHTVAPVVPSASREHVPLNPIGQISANRNASIDVTASVNQTPIGHQPVAAFKNISVNGQQVPVTVKPEGTGATFRFGVVPEAVAPARQKLPAGLPSVFFPEPAVSRAPQTLPQLGAQTFAFGGPRQTLEPFQSRQNVSPKPVFGTGQASSPIRIETNGVPAGAASLFPPLNQLNQVDRNADVLPPREGSQIEALRARKYGPNGAGATSKSIVDQSFGSWPLPASEQQQQLELTQNGLGFNRLLKVDPSDKSLIAGFDLVILPPTDPPTIEAPATVEEVGSSEGAEGEQKGAEGEQQGVEVPQERFRRTTVATPNPVEEPLWIPFDEHSQDNQGAAAFATPRSFTRLRAIPNHLWALLLGNETAAVGVTEPLPSQEEGAAANETAAEGGVLENETGSNETNSVLQPDETGLQQNVETGLQQNVETGETSLLVGEGEELGKNNTGKQSFTKNPAKTTKKPAVALPQRGNNNATSLRRSTSASATSKKISGNGTSKTVQKIKGNPTTPVSEDQSGDAAATTEIVEQEATEEVAADNLEPNEAPTNELLEVSGAAENATSAIQSNSTTSDSAGGSLFDSLGNGSRSGKAHASWQPSGEAAGLVSEFFQRGTGLCDWRPVGCSEDEQHPNRLLRASRDDFIGGSDMSIELCQNYCESKGHRIAGLEYGFICFCGECFSYAPAASDRCQTSCIGNADDNCGGKLAINVFQCYLDEKAPQPQLCSNADPAVTAAQNAKSPFAFGF